MNVRMHGNAAEIIADGVLIRTAQDALDLMMDPDLGGARRIILRREHFVPRFFDLSTKLAGDVTQKFANYRMRLAIAGSFDDASESLKAFIRESNRGTVVCFVKDAEEAIG